MPADGQRTILQDPHSGFIAYVPPGSVRKGREIVTTGARVVPAKALVLGYDFRHPEVNEALRSALG